MGEVLRWVLWLALMKALLEPVAQRLGQIVIGKTVATLLYELDQMWPRLIREEMTRTQMEAWVMGRAGELTGNAWVAQAAAEATWTQFDPRICLEHLEGSEVQRRQA